MKKILLPEGKTGVCLTGYGEWQHPLAMKARCEDGVIRTVRLNESADTYFSWGGRVTIKGKTITGYVSQANEDDEDGEPIQEFHPNKFPARPIYTVVVGNVGTVHEGKNKRAAQGMYSYYVSASKNNIGRHGGEPVTLFCGEEIIWEYAGTNGEGEGGDNE